MKILNQNQRVALIGFMGVGKTTIGQNLADNLAYKFIDIDEKIEKQYMRPTSQIFNRLGESVFRKAEKDLIFHYINTKNKVLSLGGGAFLQKEVKEACLTQCTVVYLEMTWEYWEERLDFLISSRPLLQGKDLTEIYQLFNERLPYYQDYHYKVNLDGLNIDDATEKVLKTIKR